MTKDASVFFDESGYTGPDILNSQSPLFSLASVTISEQEAEKIVKSIIKSHRLQCTELKGKILCGKNPKVESILDFLAAIEGRYAISLCEKKCFWP